MQGISSRVCPTICKITWTKSEMQIIEKIYPHNNRTSTKMRIILNVHV